MINTKTKTALLAASGLLAGLSAHAAAPARPNIIVILADDMGYSDLGCYGGEIDTPNLDKLAAEGLQYKHFYNAARCCPTRASLITGLYPHQAGCGWMGAADMGRPAYRGFLNRNCMTFGEVLRTGGYKTYMTGKWHLSTDRQNRLGMQQFWPNQRGFDHYYGIPDGAANYYKPVLLIEDEKKVETGKDFYLTDALAEKSAEYIRNHFASADAGAPLFMYVAFNAPHWPLHALQKDIDKYKNRYRAGYDAIRAQRFARQKQLGLFPAALELTPREPGVPAWEDNTPAAQEDLIMRMAIYAAQIDCLDRGVGRIVGQLKASGQYENTLIIFLSDNGGAGEFVSNGARKVADGKADTHESYRKNWANVSSAPFRDLKCYTYEGGIATPMIVHWPAGIRADLRGTRVEDYGHVTDIMATCVELAGIKYPEIYNGEKIHPLQGQSLVPHFSGETRPPRRIFWEHEGNLAVRDGKWKLVNKTLYTAEFDEATIALYDLDADPLEMNDLSKTEKARFDEMYSSWKSWAASIGALPVDTRTYDRRIRDYQKTLETTNPETPRPAKAAAKKAKAKSPAKRPRE